MRGRELFSSMAFWGGGEFVVSWKQRLFLEYEGGSCFAQGLVGLVGMSEFPAMAWCDTLSGVGVLIGVALCSGHHFARGGILLGGILLRVALLKLLWVALYSSRPSALLGRRTIVNGSYVSHRVLVHRERRRERGLYMAVCWYIQTYPSIRPGVRNSLLSALWRAWARPQSGPKSALIYGSCHKSRTLVPP
jgi:hypothetical protein